MTASPHHLITAITAALQAGKAILEIYHSGDFDIELKGDNSPLTRADTASHNVIMSYLETTDIPVLSEEGRDIPIRSVKTWKQLWIVDPIDGTKEFIKRNGEFTVNIALIENQKPIIGVIFVPVTGELYFSSKELGAFKVAVDLEDYDVELYYQKPINYHCKEKITPLPLWPVDLICLQRQKSMCKKCETSMER